MRSSSIKSLSVVTALVVALAAAPRAEAKKNTQSRVKTTLAQLISRYFGIGTQEDFPSDPIPKNQSTTTSRVKEELSPTATTPK